MTPEQWRAIERVYHAAMERSPADRGAFLDQTCAGDPALRREVDSLISHGSQPSLLDRTADGRLHARIVARLADAQAVPGRLAGRMLGAYALQSLVAAGGMGEVYRAVDTRLNRTVAVKILPPHSLDDPHARLRFRREAEIISSLNHPHICTMHDVGEQDGVDYLVMEYIEGETLQKRLARGPIPVAQALAYAVQIVDALDKAQRHGIVHRDLKPANVMIATGGIKLLDFGIATRAADSAGVPARTEPVHATPQYSAPEQLDARPVDARTDLFAFGATAYEMLCGRPAFQGSSRAELVEQVLHRDPAPIRDVRPEIPAPVARSIMRCLAKDPDERWQTASDLLFELRGLVGADRPDPTVLATRRWLPLWAERSAWAAMGLAAGLGTLLLVSPRPGDRPAASASPDIRFDLLPEPGAAFASGVDVPFALSPDGRALAYVAVGRDGIKRLWLRRFDGAPAGAREFPGTEDANTPFWSPGGEWIGCFDRHRLLKVHVPDGRVQALATASTMGGAAWSARGVILFPAGPRGLSRVDAEGGPVSPVTTEDGSHFWPQFLGDGAHFVYAAVLGREIRVGSLAGGPSRVLTRLPVKFSSLGYVRGYVFYGHDSTLFARRLDETTLRFTGDEIPLVDRIPITQLGRMPFSVSAAGSLAFWRYPGGVPATLEWLSDDGRRETVVAAPARYVGVTVTADGRGVAFSRRNADGGADIWLRDLRSSRDSQLTFDGFSFAPRAATSGNRIAFTTTVKPPLPRVAIMEPGRPRVDIQLADSAVPAFASSWCHDGRSLVTVHIDPATHDDVYLEHLDGRPAERLSINTPANDYQAAVSPDDRWIAYVTDVSGRDEVWVASFPSGEVRRQISMGGGSSPQWLAGGRDLAYVSHRRWLTARSFAADGQSVTLGSPRELVDASGFVETTPLLTPSANSYVAAPEGRRFLAAIRDRTAPPPIQVVVNWTALLPR